MNATGEKRRTVVNARFLTRRVTGLERYATEISRHLKDICPNLTFVGPRNILDRSLAGELDVEVYGRMAGHLWEQIELPRYLRRHRNPMLINLMNTGPINYHNQITVIHDLAFLRNPRWFSKRATHWFQFLVPRVVKASSAIVTQSAFTRNELLELLNVPEEKIHVVYPGVAKAFKSGARKRRKKAPGSLVLAVSTLEPRKNLARLIEAFGLLKLEGAKLIVVGGDNPLVFGKSRLKRSGWENVAVDFLGYVTDSRLADLYREADVFASVSLYEGFGFPPLEALASGCRILVSDIPSHREIFGASATYVDPLDVSDIATGLKAVLSAEEEMNEDVEKTLARFSWRRAAENLLLAIDEASKVG